MKRYPTKTRLNRPICAKCENRVIIQGIPFCRKIAPNFDPETGVCEDFQKIIIPKGIQISIFDLTTE